MRLSFPLLALAVCVQAQTPAPSGSSFPSSVPSGSPSFSARSEFPSFEPTVFEDASVSGLQADPTVCPSVREDGCSVCGEGLCVTNPTAIFAFPGQPDVQCGVLEIAGAGGLVPIEQCPFLAGMIETLCGCASSLPPPPTTAAPVVPTSAPVDPTLAPVEPTGAPVDPTAAPVIFTSVAPVPAGPTPCPEIQDDGCSVCGEGLCVTIPDAIFKFTGQPEVPCSTLQTSGATGIIPLNQCPFLPPMLNELCGCQSSVPAPPSAAPVTMAPVTAAPVVAPTDAPVTMAPVTAAPAVVPTEAPVVVPSPVAAETAETTSPSGSSFPSGSSLPSAEPSPIPGSAKSMKQPTKSSKKVAMSMIAKSDTRRVRRGLETRSVRGV